MKTIEFEAPVRNGTISIPQQFYREGFPAFVRVVVLSVDNMEISNTREYTKVMRELWNSESDTTMVAPPELPWESDAPRGPVE